MYRDAGRDERAAAEEAEAAILAEFLPQQLTEDEIEALGARGDRRDWRERSGRPRPRDGPRRTADQGARRRTAGERDRPPPARGGRDRCSSRGRSAEREARVGSGALARAGGGRHRRGCPVPGPVGEHHPRPGEPRGRPDRAAGHPRPARPRSRRPAAPRTREAAADEVTPVTETIKSPTDNQEDQLLAFDTLDRRVIRVLEPPRDPARSTTAEVLDRLGDDAPEIRSRSAPWSRR